MPFRPATPRGAATRLGVHVAKVLISLVAIAASASLGAGPASAAPSRSLMFATWNVCKTDCDAPAPPWSVRRDRVARVIAQSGADVIALNEATDQPYGPGTQWEDIQRLVGASGYVAPQIQDDRCKRLGCTHTARIIFRPASVQQLSFTGQPSAGYARVGDIAPAVSTDFDRQVTWAYLQGADTGPFLSISVHLSTFKTDAAEQHRVAFGQAVTAWAEAMNAARGLAGAPVILMGDFNSIVTRQPEGVQRVLTDSGWTDAISAPKRLNVHVNSINYTPTQRSGWPTRPIYNKWRLASRIDYIMMRGPMQPLTYEVVTHTRPSGAFDPAYQGSDHLMVRSRLLFTG
jgi:endonuclease/exonuclease/phosphatase family metal-dependent hydrolase